MLISYRQAVKESKLPFVWNFDFLGCVRLGNPDFDFEIRISKSKSGFRISIVHGNPSWRRISVIGSPFLDFAFFGEIRNPDFNRNPDFPIERTLRRFFASFEIFIYLSSSLLAIFLPFSR